MRWLLHVLFISLFCVCDLKGSTSQIYLGSREGDPASLVENVSTIHGDYSEYEIDLAVAGPDPLILSRYYSSQDTPTPAHLGGWRFYPQCYLTVL